MVNLGDLTIFILLTLRKQHTNDKDTEFFISINNTNNLTPVFWFL